jgi:tight adherence protein B
VIADDQLGVSLEQSLGAVVDRMDNRDLHQVALVAALQRDAGGNSAEVLDRVADTIRSRVALRRLVNTLTAQGRMSRWVVSFVPVGLIMFIGMVNPNYLDPLFKTAAGNVLLAVAAGMMIAGSLVMKKIADIKV